MKCAECRQEWDIDGFTPEVLAAYLVSTGWVQKREVTEVDMVQKWAVFEETSAGVTCHIDVPQMRDALDYKRCVYLHVLANLSKLEERSVEAIVLDIRVAGLMARSGLANDALVQAPENKAVQHMVGVMGRLRTAMITAVRALPDKAMEQMIIACRNSKTGCFCGAHISEVDV